ncbi:MAG: PASTA domain-containing protein [Erysipelotrichaceae bacterium]|nr:PASTA domain-containing protein [Erysipelotrichaceae bacterium]
MELLMQQTTKQFNCKSCWGGVMEVKTGKMLAWGGSPSFNPNEMEISNYNDLGASVTYEPGSTMKTFTYAAAIDSGKYNGSTKYNSGPFYIDYTSDGRLKRANSNKNYGIIRNFNNANWGKITYDQAYCRSLNTGIADIITNVINPDILSNYLDAFGFFEPVNTDGVKDVSGVRNMDTGLDAIATGYGQSSSVTALQMFQAYSAIFNEGTMMKPYFVDYIQDSYTGEIIYEGEPTVVGNPIKPETARQVVKLMKKVVTDPTYGTAKWYKISGMSLAIKTGTAEVFENGRYGSNVITSVACGMPANDPQIFIYFCYKAKYNSDMHYKTDPIKRFFRKVIKVTNLNNDLTGDEEDIPEEQTEEDDLTITKLLDTVPSLVNHTTDFAKSTLAGSGVKLIILGTGDTILKQYPEADTELTKRQKIFLMTSLTKIKMPDMTGWSRKDVNQFWEITGIGVTIEGAGYVVEQSIPKGTTLENTDTIRVVLSNESN